MKTKRWMGLGIGVAVVVAMGAAGSLLSKNDGGRAATDGPSPEVMTAERDPYMASIDAALGRATTTEQMKQGAPDAGRNSAPVPPQPASDASKQASSGGTAAGGPTGAAAATVDDRKIVQTATISLQVKDVSGGFDQVGLLAGSAGGFVASSKFSLVGDQQIASITIRVPADKYQEVLSQVRALGAKVESEGSNASDVTEEFSDLSAQLRNLQATEAQLLTFLGQAKNIAEVLQVQDRLNAVRNDIERVRGRMNLLDKLSDMATISVQLHPVAGAAKVDHEGGFGDEVSKAWQHSLDLIAGVATGVATVLVFSWWIVVLLIPAALIWQRWLRSRGGTPAAGYD